MNNSNDLLKKISSYSTVATVAVLALPSSINAELITHQLDPDSTLFNPQDTSIIFAININSTGANADDVIDFVFTMSKVDSAAYGTEIGQNIGIYAYTSNKILGNTSTFQSVNDIDGTTYTGTYNLPIVKSTGSYIGSTATSVGTGETPLFWNSYTNILVWGYTSKPSNSWGNWGGTIAQYLGLKFVTWGDSTLTPISNAAGNGDSLDNNGMVVNDTTWETTEFYGWILMDVAVDGWDFTVRAWAYNDTPGESAECKIVSINEIDINKNVSIYSHGRTINVSTEGLPNPDGKISIFDITGKLIQQQPLDNDVYSLSLLDEQAGVYFVKVEANGGSTSKKIFIE
ncbi:MAG: T9SS type A sorting domain-containing protein [Flavobacteriales bacterium]|nr:T9SS type A sorting domain-containing protein [Flavobacteriales bacterium]